MPPPCTSPKSLGEDQFEELHLCEECAQQYLYEPQQKGGIKGATPAAVERERRDRRA